LQGIAPHFRNRDTITQAIAAAGLQVVLIEPTAPGREETWFIAEAGDGKAAGRPA
jgi:hypothetical protein